jgi:hypothetical protein
VQSFEASPPVALDSLLGPTPAQTG